MDKDLFWRIVIVIAIGLTAWLLVSMMHDDCAAKHCKVGQPQMIHYSCVCVSAIPE